MRYCPELSGKQLDIQYNVMPGVQQYTNHFKLSFCSLISQILAIFLIPNNNLRSLTTDKTEYFSIYYYFCDYSFTINESLKFV